MSSQPNAIVVAVLSLAACGGGAYQKTAAPPALPASGVSYAESESIKVASTSGSSSGSSSGASGVATVAMPQQEEQVVIRGALSLKVEDVRAATGELRERIAALGGRVISDSENGSSDALRADIQLRLPPQHVSEFLAWVSGTGELTHKDVQRDDVSKQLFDQELALQNYEATMARLVAILERPDLDIEAVLKIEQEMTRVRHEIERIKGENRYLRDRVAFATFNVSISGPGSDLYNPETHFLVGFRGTGIHLLSPDGEADHFGVGLVLRAPDVPVNYEVDIFQRGENGKHGVLATMGLATYSDHLGGGRRRFLNPYLGLRLGYGYLNERSSFVSSAEAGIELFKTSFASIEASVRGTTLWGKGGAELGIEYGAMATFAF